MVNGTSYKPIIKVLIVPNGMDRTMNLDLGNLRSTKALLVLLLVYGILLPATFRIFQIDGLRSNATTSNDLANIVLNDVAPEVNETSALDI